MSEEKKQSNVIQSLWESEFTRRWTIRIVTLFVAFLLGFVPMWLSSRENARSLAQTQRDLQRIQIQQTLALASIDARRGEYEAARQSASDFFTEVRTELDSNLSVYENDEKTKINELFSARDEIITLLSRADPAGPERLSDFFISYRNIVNLPNK